VNDHGAAWGGPCPAALSLGQGAGLGRVEQKFVVKATRSSVSAKDKIEKKVDAPKSSKAESVNQDRMNV